MIAEGDYAETRLAAPHSGEFAGVVGVFVANDAIEGGQLHHFWRTLAEISSVAATRSAV